MSARRSFLGRFLDDAPWAKAAQFPHLAASIIIVLTALLYGHTLQFPFEYDDHIYLLKNPLVVNFMGFGFFDDLPGLLRYPKDNGLDLDLSINFILRPVSYFTFCLNYAWDGMQPRGFRLVNIFIHCANSILLFHLIWHLLRRSPKSTNLPVWSAGFIALITALLFVAHPLHIESVTYIVQRFTSLGAMFFLMTLVTHLLAGVARTKTASFTLQCISVAALLLGMLSKENVFTAPFVLVILDWLVMQVPLRAACRRAIPQLLCLPLIPGLLLLITCFQNHGVTSATNVLTVVDYNHISPRIYGLTELSVVLTYLRLILIPCGLNFDPDYPLTRSFLAPEVLRSLMVIGALIGGAVWWHRRRPSDPRVALLCAGVLWYFLTLTVDSGVVPLPDVMSEHRAYLPSIGALIALGCGLDLMRTKFKDRPAIRCGFSAAAAIWIGAMCEANFARNEIWRTDIALWSDTVAKSPDKYRPWHNLAIAYHEAGKLPEALACSRKVIELAPGWVNAYLDLANVANAQGKYMEAIEVAQKGLRLAPGAAELHYAMGVSHSLLGEYEYSRRALETAVALQPGHRRAIVLLAGVYAQLKLYSQSLAQFRAANSIQPLEPQALQMVAQIKALMQADASNRQSGRE